MTIVDQCQDLYGTLSRSNRRLISALLAAPTEELWHKAQSIVVCDRPILTLKAAVHRVTRDQIYTRDVPDSFTLYRALRYCVEKRTRFLTHPEPFDIES